MVARIRELLVRRLPGDLRVPGQSTIHAALDRHGLVSPWAAESYGGPTLDEDEDDVYAIPL